MKINEIRRSDIERISALKRDPAWLKDIRLKSMDLLQRIEPPLRNDEEWRRTNPEDFMLDRWEVDLEGRYGRDSVTEGLRVLQGYRGNGVVFDDLFNIEDKRGDFIRLFLEEMISSESRYFDAMRIALLDGGIFISIQDGKRIEKPVYIKEYFKAFERAVFSQIVILCGRESSVSIVDDLSSDGDSNRRFINSGVAIYMSEGSSVDYHILNRLSTDDLLYRYEFINLAPYTNLNIHEGIAGGGIIKEKASIRLGGAYARADVTGFSIISSNQRVDIFSHMVLQSQGTCGNLDFRSVIAEKGRFVFQGLIDIWKGASRADSFLSNKNLLLGERARADSIPKLQIDTNDVKAGHAVTTGRVNEEQLFYLMSKGIKRHEAEYLIISGFLEPVFEKVKNRSVKRSFAGILERKLGENNAQGDRC